MNRYKVTNKTTMESIVCTGYKEVIEYTGLNKSNINYLINNHSAKESSNWSIEVLSPATPYSYQKKIRKGYFDTELPQSLTLTKYIDSDKMVSFKDEINKGYFLIINRKNKTVYYGKPIEIELEYM